MEQGRAQRLPRRFLFFLPSGKLLFPPLNISFLLISRPPPPLSHGLSPLLSYLLSSYLIFHPLFSPVLSSLLFSSPLSSSLLLLIFQSLSPHSTWYHRIQYLFIVPSLLLIPSSFATTVHLSLILIGPLSILLLFSSICLLVSHSHYAFIYIIIIFFDLPPITFSNSKHNGLTVSNPGLVITTRLQCS